MSSSKSTPTLFISTPTTGWLLKWYSFTRPPLNPSLHYYVWSAERQWDEMGCWTSEVASVSKQQVQSGAAGALRVSYRIKHFLVSKRRCHYTSPQLVWRYNSTKHGIPSVCIAYLCLIRVCLCECIQQRRGNSLWFWEQGAANSSFMGLNIWFSALYFKPPERFVCVCMCVRWHQVYPLWASQQPDIKQINQGSHIN